MAAPIPTVEPTRVRAATTWQWRREDMTGVYPASAWTLKYSLKNASSHLELVAAADGDCFAISVPIATSTIAPGTYRMVGYVEDAGPTNRFEVYDETILVDASYASSGTIDDRSHSRIVLDAIQAVLENRATKDQEEYTIGHRMLRRTPLADLRMLRQEYEAKVRAEDQADRIAAGRGGTKIVSRL